MILPMEFTADIKRSPRTYLPENFVLTDWEGVEPFFEELMVRDISSKPALEKWLKDISELEAAVSENACWRQIRMTCDTENKELEEAFNFYCLEIQPRIQPFSDALNKKLLASPALKDLDQEKYFTYLRSVKNNIELFRDENVSLQAEMAVLQQQFGQITGAMMVEVNGEEFTLQQAGKFLESPDRELREIVYRKIQERRLKDKDKLDALFDQLIILRKKEAANAGFERYTDYRFRQLGRFDYSEKECFDFHKAVVEHVLPLVKEIYLDKKVKLALPDLRPWDLDAEPADIKPLHPFSTGEEMLQRSISCFNELDPLFASCLAKMKDLGHLDLESRKGKAPGGYNCPLAESGAPFIFMNAAGQMHDVTTMVHEGGHAVHSFLAHPLELTGFKEYPMEIAEVASMSMELFTMDHWHHFFPDPEELKRAKKYQLERVITLFPWIAVIDKFQHWLYNGKEHTPSQRSQEWMNILSEFSEGVVDYSGLENYRANAWQRQLHLFEVPFYYIEYGIAQLGAIGMWMQFREDRERALNNYCNALSLGGTRTLPELYSAAGLEFDFSPSRIKKLMDFVKVELDKVS